MIAYHDKKAAADTTKCMRTTTPKLGGIMQNREREREDVCILPDKVY